VGASGVSPDPTDGDLMDALDLLAFEWKPARLEDIDSLPDRVYELMFSIKSGLSKSRYRPQEARGEIDGVPVGPPM